MGSGTWASSSGERWSRSGPAAIATAVRRQWAQAGLQPEPGLLVHFPSLSTNRAEANTDTQPLSNSMQYASCKVHPERI